MQRARRALDNPALDVAVELGNELGKPVVVFLARMPFIRILTCVTVRQFDSMSYIAEIGSLERTHV
jgi:hypothetical protein